MNPERARPRSEARAELALTLLSRTSIAGGRLLDVGCGPGWALERFRAAGFEAQGVESSPSAVAQACARGLKAELLDVESGALPAGFHVVAALEVLEHLRDPLSVLEAMARSLLPGGRIVVSLPNEFHLQRRMSILLGRPRSGGHRQFGGHEDPHLRYFTPRLSVELFEAARLRVLGTLWDGLLPPRFGAAARISRGMARLWPSLFAISGVHLLLPEGSAGTGTGTGTGEEGTG